MKKNSICKIIVSGLLAVVPLMGMAQQVCGNKPWSVRMAESEMVRCPESWQLDFQTRLKWDYCHGLELQAMLDVYDAYGDKKFFDYAVAYADTMIHQDGSIETYKLEEYNIDRLNSGKMLFRIYEQTKDEKYKKALDYCAVNWIRIPVTPMAVSGTRRFMRTRCGWTGFIWDNRSMRSMLTVTTV